MLKKELEQIKESGLFELLDPYKDPKQWKLMDESDKQLLAVLFFQHGIQTSLNNPNKASFKKSAQLFRLAIRLESTFLQAHYELGKIYIDLGVVTEDINFFEKSDAVFKGILTNLPKNRGFQSAFFWTWARCWFLKGRLSGEWIDFSKAFEYFAAAKEAGQDDPLFWTDYGNAYFEVDRLAPDSPSFEAAIECYVKATKRDSSCFEAWSNLGCCYTDLFFERRAPSYFHLANDCFTKLEALQKGSREYFFKWGQLLLAFAKSFNEDRHLPKCIECFQKAEETGAPKGPLYRFAAEALLLYGVGTDQVSLMKLAENKVRLSLDVDAKDASTWCLLGHVKCEFGRYFDEETYFLDAIEAFEKGIEFVDNNPILYFGLATASFAYGDMKGDILFLERAYKACAKVIEIGASPPDHFWNDWGIIALKIGETTKKMDFLREAISFFEKGVEIQKAQQRNFSSDLLVNLGVAWQLLGDFEDDERALIMSREILSEAIRLDPLFITAHHQLALTLVELGEMTDDLRCFEVANQHFTHALHLDSEDDFIAHDFGMGLIHQSIVLHQSGQMEASSKVAKEAEKMLKRAISLGNEGAFYTLSCLYSLVGNLTESLKALQKAASLDCLPEREDLLEDEWLENLRSSEHFSSFLENK